MVWQNVLPAVGFGGLFSALGLFAIRIFMSADKTRIAQVNEAKKEADDRQVRLDSSRERIDKLEKDKSDLNDQNRLAESQTSIAKANVEVLRIQLASYKELAEAQAKEIKRLTNGGA